MDRRTIGRLVNYERNKRKISAQKLTQGICSLSALQRLESGERLPDFFVLERIIERLGKSVNKIEFLYNEQAYEIYYLREIIEEYLEKKSYDEAEDALAYYMCRPEAKETLHRQYIYKIQAVILSERSQNHEVAKELIQNALEQTVPGFLMHELESYLLGEGELLLLLLWIQENAATGNLHFQLDSERLLEYIERVCQDEEVKANVYSKAAWVCGTVAMEQQNWKDALWYTLQGERVLTENGLLMHLPQFLERILELTGKQKSGEQEEWRKQRDALKKLYDEYGEVWQADDIDLWKNYRQLEVYLVSEVFGQERKLRNHSQERLAEALEIDQKTISRIETGRYKPKAGTFQKMKEYLQIDRDICTTRIVTDDFSILEMERKVAKLNHLRREEEAEKLFEQLKKKLSPEWKEDLQYIKYMEALFALELGRVTENEAVELCKEAFQITRKNGIAQIEHIVFSRMEAFIINYIARCYDEIGMKDGAIELVEAVIKGYESSKVDVKYHYAALALLYQHLAFNYEECGRLEESIQWCDNTILLDLKCKRGLNIGIMRREKVYCMEQKMHDEEWSKANYQQAFQLLKLMRKERQMKRLQSRYREWYGEEIE